jgi:hypothetical protein
METPEGGFNMAALIEDMQSISANLSSMIKIPPLGFSEYYTTKYRRAGADGVATEYAPLPGSTIPDGTVADVIDIHRRRS